MRVRLRPRARAPARPAFSHLRMCVHTPRNPGRPAARTHARTPPACSHHAARHGTATHRTALHRARCTARTHLHRTHTPRWHHGLINDNKDNVKAAMYWKEAAAQVRATRCVALYSYGLYSHDLHSYGLHSHGLYIVMACPVMAPHSYGLHT